MHARFVHLAGLAVLAAFVLDVLLACSSGDGSRADGGLDVDASTDAGSSGPEAPVVTAEVEPFDFTDVLSDNAAAMLTSVEDEGATLVFEGSTPELDALTADRILVVPAGPLAPRGMLRRIDSVERDVDRVTLVTREASLVHAFRKVDIRIEAAAPSASQLPPYPTALSVGSGSGALPFTHDIDWVVFDGDKDPSTTEDRVLVSGELQATVGYTFELAFDWGALSDIVDCLEDPGLDCIEALNPLEIASDIGFTLSFVSALSAGADLTVSGAAALSFEREIELGEPYYLGVIQAGPIQLWPRLVASAGVEGGANANLDVDVQVAGGVEVGIEASGTSVTPVGQGPYLDTPQGSATLQNAAHVRAWVHPRVEMLIYSVLGPSIGLQPYARVDADTDDDPCWRMSGGLDATLGITLAVGPVTLIDEHTSVPIESAQFASGDCLLPAGAGGGSLDPTFAPWAAGMKGSLYSAGTLDDSTALAPTHDGNFLFTASTATGLLKLSAQGEPLWIRSYLRDDLERLYPQRAVSLADATLLVFGPRGAVLHTDELGELLDAQRLDIADDPNARIGAVARTEAGGAWLAGNTPLPGGGADGWLARFAPDGSLLDAFAIRGPLEEAPTAIVLLADGGAMIAGQSLDAGARRAWAARVDADGNAAWFVRLVDCAIEAGLGEDTIAVRAAALTHDGNFALAGYTFYPRYFGMLAKLREADGSVAWGQTYAAGTGLGLQLESVSALESGGFLLAGTQVAIGSNDALALAETDSAGVVSWVQRYDGPGRDGLPSLWRTPADNGVMLSATAENLFSGSAAAALLMKVPRKDGAIALDAAQGASVASITLADAGVCLASEPYAGGVIEPIAAQLVHVRAVVAEEVAIERVRLHAE